MGHQKSGSRVGTDAGLKYSTVSKPAGFPESIGSNRCDMSYRPFSRYLIRKYICICIVLQNTGLFERYSVGAAVCNTVTVTVTGWSSGVE